MWNNIVKKGPIQHKLPPLICLHILFVNSTVCLNLSRLLRLLQNYISHECRLARAARLPVFFTPWRQTKEILQLTGVVEMPKNTTEKYEQSQKYMAQNPVIKAGEHFWQSSSRCSCYYFFRPLQATFQQCMFMWLLSCRDNGNKDLKRTVLAD